MGWIESPPYFCAASETARNVAQQYAETPLDSLPNHKFLPYTNMEQDFTTLPLMSQTQDCKYIMEVYMDNYITAAMALSQQHLNHMANATMAGIHDVFLEDNAPELDPISEQKLKKFYCLQLLTPYNFLLLAIAT